MKSRAASISDLMMSLNTKGPGTATIGVTVVIDPQLLSEAGGDMLVAKIPSPNKIEKLKYQPGMFFTLQVGSLLVADCRLLENLRDATVRAVQDDPLFKIIFFSSFG